MFLIPIIRQSLKKILGDVIVCDITGDFFFFSQKVRGLLLYLKFSIVVVTLERSPQSTQKATV